MKLANTILLVIFLGLSAQADQTASPNPENQTVAASDYGTLYMIEEKQAETPRWQVGAAYGFELSNPYLAVNSVNVQVGRQLSRHFALGVQAYRYFTQVTAVTEAVETKMGSKSIRQIVQRPQDAFYGTVSASPLSGRLNLFSLTSLEFDIVATVGGGLVRYTVGKPLSSVLWSVAPQVMLTRAIGLSFGIGQEIEAPLSDLALARLESKVGTFVRF